MDLNKDHSCRETQLTLEIRPENTISVCSEKIEIVIVNLIEFF